ncbi:MAG: gluconokinase [Akkermansiaceae bacterium]
MKTLQTKAIVVMGVCGSGKSTVGTLLAERINGVFLDGDDFHPPENVAKMRAGTPLDDDDRKGWLEALAREIREAKEPTVIACSALKESYRDILSGAEFIFLNGSEELLAERLAARQNHYMPPGLLRSQLETLEAPADALVLDIRKSPGKLVDEIIARI